MRIRNIYLFEFHVTAAWTFQRIMVERTFDTENPALYDAYGSAEMAFHLRRARSGTFTYASSDTDRRNRRPG